MRVVVINRPVSCQACSRAQRPRPSRGRKWHLTITLQYNSPELYTVLYILRPITTSESVLPATFFLMTQASTARTDSDVEKGDAIQPRADTGILAVTFPFLPELTHVKQVKISPKKLRRHRLSHHPRIRKENHNLGTAQGRSLPYIQIFQRNRTPTWPIAGKRTLTESSLSWVLIPTFMPLNTY